MHLMTNAVDVCCMQLHSVLRFTRLVGRVLIQLKPTIPAAAGSTAPIPTYVLTHVQGVAYTDF